MKKLLCLSLALILLLLSLPLCAGAEAPKDSVISLCLTNDIAGLDYHDYDKIAVILSDNIEYCTIDRFGILQINDYVGDVYLEKLKPGRTYTVSYTFSPVEGFTVPDVLTDEELELTCSDGCTVIWCRSAIGTQDDGCPINLVSLYAEITVKGNFLQMLFGRILDRIAKILAWSPY